MRSSTRKRLATAILATLVVADRRARASGDSRRPRMGDSFRIVRQVFGSAGPLGVTVEAVIRRKLREFGSAGRATAWHARG